MHLDESYSILFVYQWVSAKFFFTWTQSFLSVALRRQSAGVHVMHGVKCVLLDGCRQNWFSGNWFLSVTAAQYQKCFGDKTFLCFSLCFCQSGSSKVCCVCRNKVFTRVVVNWRMGLPRGSLLILLDSCFQLRSIVAVRVLRRSCTQPGFNVDICD